MDSNAIVNAILSFFIPGLGQGINGYTQKAIIMVVIFVVLCIIRIIVYPGLLTDAISLIYRLYAAYDAYKTY